jgi:hypothetical protein
MDGSIRPRGATMKKAANESRLSMGPKHPKNA